MKLTKYKAVLIPVLFASLSIWQTRTGLGSVNSYPAGQGHPLRAGARISLRTMSGDITIRGWDRNVVRAVMNGEESSPNGGVNFEEDSSGNLSIIPDREALARHGDSHIMVDVPRSAGIQSAHTLGGNITIDGMEGPVNISTAHGDIRVDGSGILAATSGSGDVRVNGVSGNATLQTGSGDVTAQSVTGSVSITTGSGEVRATKTGSVNLRTGDGAVTATSINGSASVQTSSGDVIASDVKGDLVGRVSSGDVQLRNIGGLVNLSITSGDVTVDRSGGDVKISSISGSIEVKCAGGNVEAGSADGSIGIIGPAGDVDVKTTSGEVSFVGAIRVSGRYRLRSTSGSVSMKIQDSTPGFTATLSSYSGEIDTDFPIKLDNVLQHGPVNKRIIGRYGNGQADINLDSFSGTVTLGKVPESSLADCK